MSIRLNKALRELNIGLQTAVEFLEKRNELGEVKNELSFKLSEAQYQALIEAFKQDAEVRSQAERLFSKKSKDKKPSREAKDNRAESLNRWVKAISTTSVRNRLPIHLSSLRRRGLRRKNLLPKAPLPKHRKRQLRQQSNRLLYKKSKTQKPLCRLKKRQTCNPLIMRWL